MKKKTSIIIGVIVAIVIAMIGGGIAVSGVLNSYEKQIKLGYKMINEEKYEEAILAFNTAIEIDPKQEKAYIGLADTYVTRCDKNTVNDASDTLRRGYEQSESEKIVQGYINSAQVLYNKDKKDWAIKLLQYGHELTNSDKLKARIDELIHNIIMLNKEFLENLYTICENNDLEQIKTIAKTEEFKKVSKYATKNNPILYFKDNNSKGVGIYEESNNPKCIYFGDYVDGLRSGEGIWMTEDLFYIFKLSWINDKPNGKGIGERNNYSDQVGRFVEKMSGNLINGLWVNEVLEEVNYDKGEQIKIKYNFNNGIYVPIGTLDEDGGLYYKVGTGSIKDDHSSEWKEHYMSVSAKDINITHGVFGFSERY